MKGAAFNLCGLSLALAALLVLDGCMLERPRLVKTETQVFTIESLDPPKHVYVDLRRADGIVFKRVHVGKHCNTWRQIVIGSTVALQVDTYERDGKQWESIQAFPVCPRPPSLATQPKA